MTGLAAFSLLHCDLPAALAWPAAGMALMIGGLTLWRRANRAAREFLFTANLSACRLDGQPLSHLDLRWRGPLLFVRWKQPMQRRWRHVVFWPDTLPADKRRELRLSAPVVLTSIMS